MKIPWLVNVVIFRNGVCFGVILGVLVMFNLLKSEGISLSEDSFSIYGNFEIIGQWNCWIGGKL